MHIIGYNCGTQQNSYDNLPSYLPIIKARIIVLQKMYMCILWEAMTTIYFKFETIKGLLNCTTRILQSNENYIQTVLRKSVEVL